MTHVGYHVARFSPSKQDYIRNVIGSTDSVLLRSEIHKRGLDSVLKDEWKEVWMRDSYATYTEAIGQLTSYGNARVYEIALDELRPYYEEVMQ